MRTSSARPSPPLARPWWQFTAAQLLGLAVVAAVLAGIVTYALKARMTLPGQETASISPPLTEPATDDGGNRQSVRADVQAPAPSQPATGQTDDVVSEQRPAAPDSRAPAVAGDLPSVDTPAGDGAPSAPVQSAQRLTPPPSPNPSTPQATATVEPEGGKAPGGQGESGDTQDTSRQELPASPSPAAVASTPSAQPAAPPTPDSSNPAPAKPSQTIATTQPPEGSSAPTATLHTGSLAPAPPSKAVPRALELLRNGDVAGARLWLEQGVAAGEAQAAFHLAETYDPRMLRRWRVVGVTSDPRRARDLYRRALDGGVTEAQSRLQ